MYNWNTSDWLYHLVCTNYAFYKKTRASFLIKKDLRNVVICINFEMYHKIYISSEQSKWPYVPFCTQATTLEKYNQKHNIFMILEYFKKDWK